MNQTKCAPVLGRTRMHLLTSTSEREWNTLAASAIVLQSFALAVATNGCSGDRFASIGALLSM
jgi:hypothetical protein